MKKKRTDDFAGKGINFRLYWTDFAWFTCLTGIFIVCLELFYRMIVDFNDKYSSDMRYYAVTNLTNGEKHDRILAIFFQKLYDINNNTMEINIYLAAVIVAIVIMNYCVIRFFISHDGLSNSVPRYVIQVFSVIALFTGPIFFPRLHEWYYMHSFESFAWHSPTQQSMTLFSMIATLCFLKMFLKYEKSISPRWWLATTVTLIFSASTKPSFAVDFIVSAIVLFLVELVKSASFDLWSTFKKLFIMGCSLIPSGLYILFLESMEFGETTINGEEHHIIYGLGVMLKHHGTLRAFTFGMALAIIVFTVNFKRFKESKYLLTFMVFFTGVMQWALVSETGRRAKYGNFDWGRMYGDYFLTLVCLALLLENYYNKESVFNGKKKARIIYFCIVGIVLILSVLSQLNYFRLILTGHGYMR